MTDEQPTGYCTTQPLPGAYLTPSTLTAPCPDCGHATLMHIGVGHCPVCELVDLNQQARAGATNVTVNVSGDLSHAEKAWAEIQRRHRLGLPRAAYNPEASDA